MHLPGVYLQDEKLATPLERQRLKPLKRAKLKWDSWFWALMRLEWSVIGTKLGSFNGLNRVLLRN